MGFKPVHSAGESPLTTVNVSLGGFINLLLVLLSVFVLRMALENFSENGILMTIGLGFNPFDVTVLCLLLALNLFIFIAFLIVKLAAQSVIGSAMEFAVATINLVVLLIVPVIVIFAFDTNPVGSFVVVGLYTIVFLKLWSYAAVNRACRADWAAGDSPSQPPPLGRRRSRRLLGLEPDMCLKTTKSTKPVEPVYPKNVTLRDLYFFMLAPTLCYEINYPRTDGVRKGHLCRLLLQLVVLFQVWLWMLQQWTAPGVVATAQPILNLEVIQLTAAFLKVAVANHLAWLVFFYIYFHLILNIFAEMTSFADRKFYEDWWNSSNLEEFWRKWNVPVHRWCVRHIYKPLRVYGYSKLQAKILVFLFSAFFHEYVASVSLKMIAHWSFSGMMAQIPLIALTEGFGHQTGNTMVWLSLVIGQPVGLVAYYIQCQFY